MLFNSLQFVFFFGFVFVLYYMLPHRFRWVLLLASSCYFYTAFVPKYILILGFLIITDYVLALCIEHAQEKEKKLFLYLSIVSNIGVLAFFKYFNFFSDSVGQFAHFIHWNYSPLVLSIILPLGLSFHVFQSLSYVIEVYKGRYKAERHLGIYALYVMFFPQLVAGPIERPQHLLPQLKAEHAFNEANVLEGFTLMLFGFFKKLVIADGLALLVDQVFSNLGKENGLIIVLAVLAFSFQLYCDFSGYSDIALGAAKTLGIDLTPNFNRPYAARSITEFWRRWHMSLSSWLRDYLYNPLAFELRGFDGAGALLALFISFTAIGLWHGAGWTYVAFGAVHGLYMVCGSLTKTFRARLAERIYLTRLPRLRGCLQQVTTFALVSFSWIFFRATNSHDVVTVLKRLCTGWGQVFHVSYLHADALTTAVLNISKAKLGIIAISIIIMEILQLYQAHLPLYQSLVNRPRWFRWGFYYAVTLWILCFGYFNQRYFVYFQF